MAELHFYDFDGTLFHSPYPPEGWADPDAWWRDSLSLSAPCVPDRPGSGWWNEPVVAAAKASISNSEVLAVLCTGRSLKSFARYRVSELLRQKGLLFDEVLLNPEGSTSSFKKSVLLKKLALYPDLEAVHIYEDRLNHLAEFCRLVEAQGVACIPHPIRERRTRCEVTSEELKESESSVRVAARWTLRLGGVKVSGKRP